MLGVYENFPSNIHRRDIFKSSFSGRKLQLRIIEILQETNGKTLIFEEVGSPSVRDCELVFEWGIADIGGFTYIDEEEGKKITAAVTNEHFRTIDLYCGIRYHKTTEGKKIPMKFDYYMVRLFLGENQHVEFQIFHERGPRHISPEELVNFLVAKINMTFPKKALKPVEPT